MYRGITSDEVRITGHNGDEINAYFVRPKGEGPFGGVALLHHMPGWDEQTAEKANRFAAHGYLAIMPNLHLRAGGFDVAPDDAAAATRAAGGVPDDQMLGDLKGAVDYIRAQQDSNQKVGVIGYCSGGRQSFVAACSLDVDAAVDCYGAFVVREVPDAVKMNLKPALHLGENLRCPLLGLFGNEDQFPSPEEVDELEAELKRLGKEYEFHRFDGAGHGFFGWDRDSYRPAAAVQGWKTIFDFYGRHLSA
jgi:carboxymethylenebutenolidase